MLGRPFYSAFQGFVPPPARPAFMPRFQLQPVMDQSHPMAWHAHHAAINDLAHRHAGTVHPGYFSVGAPHVAQKSPLRFIRSTLDYSGLPLGPVLGRHSQGNIHRVLTPQGYPTGTVLIVNPSTRSRNIPGEIERLAALSEQGIPVPEILSYGNFRGHSALLMRENAPLYAALQAPHRPHRMHQMHQMRSHGY